MEHQWRTAVVFGSYYSSFLSLHSEIPHSFFVSPHYRNLNYLPISFNNDSAVVISRHGRDRPTDSAVSKNKTHYQPTNNNERLSLLAEYLISTNNNNLSTADRILVPSRIHTHRICRPWHLQKKKNVRGAPLPLNILIW